MKSSVDVQRRVPSVRLPEVSPDGNLDETFVEDRSQIILRENSYLESDGRPTDGFAWTLNQRVEGSSPSGAPSKPLVANSL